MHGNQRAPYLSELIGRIGRTAQSHKQLADLARLNCCEHPSELRKPYYQRYLDFLYMMIRWGELSTRYHAQQVDLIGRKIRKDYLSYQRFIRDRQNIRTRRFDYACLLQNKLVFERHFSSARLPTAPILGIVNTGLSANFPDYSSGAVDFWTLGKNQLMERRLFCKPQHGIKGAGAFTLQFKNSHALLNGKPVNREQLSSAMQCAYMVQPVIQQHDLLAQFHPKSLNTIRMITFNLPEGIELFLTHLRMGAEGQINDNNNASRAIVRVHQDSGRLYDVGYSIQSEHLSLASAHPTTGIKFANQAIPHFNACCELAIAAHKEIPEMLSIGWDIAITPSGPLLLEGNDDWGATTAMWAMPDFREQFIARTRKGGRNESFANGRRPDSYVAGAVVPLAFPAEFDNHAASGP
ncbi:MAG: sugar-transfer associated ATP-grasp domain-containing protein [Gammaproteobacteria bacterium]